MRYDFYCSACGKIETFSTSISERSDNNFIPPICPDCQNPMSQYFGYSTPHFGSIGSKTWNHDWELDKTMDDIKRSGGKTSWGK